MRGVGRIQLILSGRGAGLQNRCFYRCTAGSCHCCGYLVPSWVLIVKYI